MLMQPGARHLAQDERRGSAASAAEGWTLLCATVLIRSATLLLRFRGLILHHHRRFQVVQRGKRYSVSGVCILIAIDHGYQWLKRHLKHFWWLRNYFPRHVCVKADAFHREI